MFENPNSKALLIQSIFFIIIDLVLSIVFCTIMFFIDAFLVTREIDLIPFQVVLMINACLIIWPVFQISIFIQKKIFKEIQVTRTFLIYTVLGSALFSVLGFVGLIAWMFSNADL